MIDMENGGGGTTAEPEAIGPLSSGGRGVSWPPKSIRE